MDATNEIQQRKRLKLSGSGVEKDEKTKRIDQGGLSWRRLPRTHDETKEKGAGAFSRQTDFVDHRSQLCLGIDQGLLPHTPLPD
jgi:hypothetical protein